MSPFEITRDEAKVTGTYSDQNVCVCLRNQDDIGEKRRFARSIPSWTRFAEAALKDEKGVNRRVTISIFTPFSQGSITPNLR